MEKQKLRDEYKKLMKSIASFENMKANESDFRKQCVIDIHIKDCIKRQKRILSIAKHKGWIKNN